MRLLIFGDFKASKIDQISLSSELKQCISESDVNICNFEAPIQIEGAIPAKKSGPSICQSVLAPEFLENAGFNIVLLANNHMMDYGPDSCLKTIEAFNRADTIGAGEGAKAYDVLIKEYEGIKVGFLSLSQYEFGMTLSNTSNKMGVAWVNAPCVRDIIEDAKKTVDYLLVFPHAGVEYTDAPLPEWRGVYKRMIDWGADCIIAAHPHVPQGWETYKNKPVFYSLGNFYFEGRWGNPWCTKGLAVDLRIDKDHLSFEVIPISFNDGLVDVDNSEEYRIHREKICELLQKEDQYLNYINEKCQVLYKDMQYGLLRGLYGVSPRVSIKQNIRLLGCLLLNKKNELFFLNAIRCESHRWVIERYLQNNNC
jgi:poly-gamma-glutamate synthesis protein (capsule biosynthesis protein)